ncbi:MULTISPECIES: hypothetical protein [Streptomyces]|uniref:ATP-binding protein n=1 Tax=Streptomyces venezuelae TaxID=54571 RepID=A0A5P2AP50_STRVZ|nr:hypothetical protein [Streptomyces venezuelae]QES18641.1 hypothetical protein DEJ46_05715 [Streptomyces venezuelae]
MGWQAKFWLSKEQVDAAKGQLDKSVQAALTQHPTLVRYVVALPLDPTGPTGGRGMSLYEKVLGEEGWREGWRRIAAERGMQVDFQVEWATNLITRFRTVDTTGVRTRYWFDAEVLADQWWQHRLEEAVQAARPRYMPELSVRVPVTQHALGALCGDDEWHRRVEADISELEGLLKNLRVDPFGSQQLAGSPSADLESVRQRGADLVTALAQWQHGPCDASIDALRIALAAVQQASNDAEGAEADALTAAHGTGWDTPSWRQWQAEYMVSFPSAAADALRKLNGLLADVAAWITGPMERLRTAHSVLLTSAAGMGKTFVTLDYVSQRLRSGCPSLLVHGRHFREGPLLEQLRVRLDLPADLTGDDFLGLLNQAGRSAGSPVLLVIDALNESRPRTIWRDELDTLITKIGRFEHLRVVFTFRSHYRFQVLPDEADMPEIVHRGFEEVEYDAIQEYADFYQLEPPTAPPVQAEFSSPLFLRLLCEALKDQGRRSLDKASMGLDDLADLLLEQTNRRISAQLNAPVADQIVHQAMLGIAERMGGHTRPWIDRGSAHNLLRGIWPDRSAETSLLEALVGEGLLAEDIDPASTGPQRHVVAMAFERLGQHLIIVAATSALNRKDDVRQALTSGSLRQLLGLDALPDPGLLEALSVILGHRGMELTDFRDEIGDEQAIAAVIAGLPWRSDTSISADTVDCVDDALRAQETFDEAMNMLFRLATRPDHALNADHLDALLSARRMADIDAVLTPWLYATRDEGGAAHRLISWAREQDITHTGRETSRLWVTALLWCTGCSDRRVRDDATLAAARLLTVHPEHAPAMLAHFLDVEDDWIIERTCYAAYTALLRSGSVADWHAAAQAAWEVMASEASPLNAALRDELRRIVEAAAERKALPAGVDLDRVRPPYSTSWPISWPKPEDVEPYKENRGDYPKLHFSCTADDFFTYVIKSTLRKRTGIDPQAAARRVLLDAVQLGYSPHLHASFDQHVMDTYGGGRGKPKWIERISKKYQWIAFARVLGQINDHVSQACGRWDPPPPSVPGPQATQLRQMDPTVCDAQPDDTALARPHVPSYDWESFDQAASPGEWIADEGDLPEIPVDVNASLTPKVVLAGTYEWRREGEPKNNCPTIWAHLVSLLVKKQDLDVLLAELTGEDLAEYVSSASGAMYTDGFVGEYPFGQHYVAEAHVRAHEHEEPFSVVTLPTTFALLGEYEYSPTSQISLIAPSPRLFGPAPGQLRWDGARTWRDAAGQSIATVRKVFGGGQNELLIDRAWLDAWLGDQDMTLVWLELLGKDILRTSLNDESPGRLVRSQARYRTDDGQVDFLPSSYDRIEPWPSNGERGASRTIA